MKQYKTKQRDAILSLFKRNPDRCYSAREIIESGAVEAGAATVYRTLAMLSEEKRLIRFRSSGGDLYKLSCRDEHAPHMHIVCDVCGGIIHSDCPFIREMEDHLLAEHGFFMDPGKTVIYGRCSGCAAAERDADRETGSASGTAGEAGR